MISLFLLFAIVSSDEPSSLRGIVNQHNYYRCLHGSPFLLWDDALQGSAQIWAQTRAADSCINQPSGTNYGENMLWSHAISRAGRQTVDAWYQNNFLGQNGQLNPQISDVTGPFNQVIWKATRKVGCAVVSCPQLQDELVVCHYDPAGNVATDDDAKANTNSVSRTVPECQTIADGHEAGMFVSEETDETNPAAIAVGAGIGGITTILFGVFFFLNREGYKTWTSARLANQQPLVLTVIEICLQIIVFALMVRALQVDVPWCNLVDGSTFNPGQVCFQRTKNGNVDRPCQPYTVAAICSHEYICNSVAAPATAIVFLILACVCSWINLVCEALQLSPRLPVSPKYFMPVALGAVFAQVAFVWNVLWFMGGYIVSYLSLNGFAMANEGSIELIVCLALFVPMLIICTAQLTLNTKG